ncbi:MAG: hypothetical protein APF80_12630 [Alphaproteobacteria bacterium BRH_c36]|nr:MAG: hypothetical protein APF80_12630 [Alphaproteobacteria bacterium BRH_c36]
MKKALFILVSVGTLVFAASAGLAHHGWSWTTGGNIDLTGIIKSAKLGNPHGVVTVDVEGVTWTVEVGQPWRNERAGLEDADFAIGNEMRFVGQPAADLSKKLMKAERIYIGEKEYKLYPDRD